MYRRLRPFLFWLDAEQAHHAGMAAAGVGQQVPGVVRRLFAFEEQPTGARLAQTLWPDRGGLRFRNPVGLAAGFDKNAARVPFWDALGFGFAEVGSVTALPSTGNPTPRAFRLPDDSALVNRMGLNNDGAAAVAERLASTPAPEGFVLGVNVAKTHSADILGDAALDDFATSVRHVARHAGYLALNVSCPNTAEGKTFEEPAALDGLLTRVQAVLDDLGARPPVLVKFSPPMLVDGQPDFGGIDELVALCLEHDVDGFIATNTASDRSGLTADAAALDRIGRGGLSGAPLQARSTALVRHLYRLTDGAAPIIGVGGVDSGAAAYEKIRAGASLVELYTGLVYEGPALVGRINRDLIRFLDRDGFGTLAEAVGSETVGAGT
ncbi:MAG: quinone-dependent dihydroorotate dehydrogenase [Bacteroidota bacterium]